MNATRYCCLYLLTKELPINTIYRGLRVRLLSTTDGYTKLKSGDEGTIDFVDDLGTVHVKWDEGSSLGLVPGEDRYTII